MPDEGSAFGFNDVGDLLAEPEVEGEVQDQGAAPGEPAATTEQATEVEPALDQVHIPQPGEEGYRWAAKYEDPLQLEQGYRELNARWTQDSQRAAAAEARAAKLDEALREALPYIQAGLQAQGGVGPGGVASPEEIDFDDPDAVNAFIDRKVAERMAPLQQQFEQQNQAQTYQSQVQQYQEAGQRAIATWQARHPEVAGTAVEDEMAGIITQHNLDIRDPEQIDFAYSMWQNPAIGDFVRANPARATSPEGRREAVLLAQQFAAPTGAGAPPAGTAPAASGGPVGNGRATVARPRPVAHVETGGTGAPVAGAPGERGSRPKDEFDEVLELLTGTKNTPFGLRVPR